LGKPVTAKIRTSQNILQTIKLAKQLEKAGVSALAVHARPIKLKNKGFVDFVAIKRIKKALGIPVIGNGGVRGKKGFDRMIDKTGCDAVMVGTGCIGNPGLFAEILGNKSISRGKAFSKYLELSQRFGIDYFGRIKVQATKFFENDSRKVSNLEKAESLKELVAAAKAS